MQSKLRVRIVLLLIALVLSSCQKRTKKLIGVVPKAGVDILWNGTREEPEFSRQIEIVDSMVA